MGMWEGLYTGLQNIRAREEREMDREEARRIREEDREIRRRELEQARVDAYRKVMLPTLLERQEEARAEQEAINTGVSIGLLRPVSEALHRSGQLGRTIARVEELDLAPREITAINETIMQQLGDRAETSTAAAAILGVLDSDIDFEDPVQVTQALIQSVVSATSMEDFQSVYGQLPAAGGSRIEPFEFSLSTQNIGLSETRQIRNQIVERLAPLYGRNRVVYSATGEAGFAQNPPEAVNLMINSLTDEVIKRSQRVGVDQMRPVDAIEQLTNAVVQAYTTGTRDASQVYSNLPTLFEQGPEPFIKIFQTSSDETAPPPPPPPRVDATGTSDAAQTMMDIAGRDRETGLPVAVPPPRIEIPEVRNPSDFRSVIDEEFTR
jgi:hypothetical protein